MAQYRKKPLVDAFQWLGDINQTDNPYWFKQLDQNGRLGFKRTKEGLFNAYLMTENGQIEAAPNDYIVKDLGGSFSIYKPDLFNLIYELVE